MASNNTNYPSFSFLPQQWNHCSRRNFFLNHGSRGSIYINEDGETLVQKTHEGSRMRPLSAQFPSLPLFEKPKYGLSDVDHVGQDILNEQKEKMKILIKKMKKLNTLYKKKKRDPDAVSCLLKCVSNYENGDCSAETVFQQFHEMASLKKLYKKYSRMFDIVSIPQTNTAFTGGCLQVIDFFDDSSPTDEAGSVCMTAVSGLDLNKIKIFKADLDVSGMLTVDESKSNEIQSSQPLLELSNQCLYDHSLCAARSMDSVLVHKIFPEYFQFQTSKVNEIKFEDETLTSIFMSPYIGAECLIATSTGSIYLWDVNRKQDLVYRQSEPIDPQYSWSDVHYGSHPRSVVLTTHKTMDLIDLRTPAKKTTNLFNLPNRHLNTKERLQVSKYSTNNSFQHFLATDYALFLLDERFPTYPVLQWQHMLTSVPQYMSLVRGVVQSTLDDVLLIGSQYPPELIAIQYRSAENEPPIAVCSPWRISKNLDFFYMDNMHYKVENELIKKRLTTPCIGIAGQSLNPEGMLVFQLNSLSDIFFQKYNQSTTFQDKTCSAGPGDHLVPLSMEARCRGRYWMEHLREYVQEDYFCEKEHQNISSLIKSLSVPPDSHILCRLCMPQCDNEDVESDEDIMTESCMTCCSTLRESKWMVDGIESDKVIKSTDVSIETKIPSTENISKSSYALTKTLCKLWNDEELSEEEEEKEVEKQVESEGEREKETEVNRESAVEEEKEVEEEEEEEKEEEEIKEMDLLQKSTLNFVDWGGYESGESESATKLPPSEYNIPSTLDEPDSPLIFSPTQSQTVVTIPESIPMFWELSQGRESFTSPPPERTSADSTNRNLSAPRLSFINRNSQKQEDKNRPASSFFTDDTYTPTQAKSPVASPYRYTPSQRSLYFDDISIPQSTQENFLGFLSTAMSQSQIENSQQSYLGKDIAYEDGFGTITASQNTKPSHLSSTFSSLDKMSFKTPPSKRKFEDGF